MSLISNNAGLIITKGLGGPATCGMITSRYGLQCGCSIELEVLPPIISGGGPVGGFYVPLPHKLKYQTRTVLITVKFNETNVWRQIFTVGTNRINILIKTINFMNKTKERLAANVERMQTATKRVITRFKNK